MTTPRPWSIWMPNDGSVNIVGPDNEFVCLVGRIHPNDPDVNDRQKILDDANLIVAAANKEA